MAAIILAVFSLPLATNAAEAPTKAPSAEIISDGVFFRDVQGKLWYKDGVDYCAYNGFMSGVSATRFDPDSALTRAMLVSVLYRVEGSPQADADIPFRDVKSTWYTDAVKWAYEKEIVSGVSATRFDPEAFATREQIATILYKYAEFSGCEMKEAAEIDSFSDADKVSPWATEAIKWAYAESFIVGVSDYGSVSLSPDGVITRAQLASIIQRFVQRFRVELYSKNILFVGNSYTYYNDMPTKIFAGIAKEAGYLFNVTMITKAHSTLELATDPTTEIGAKIAEALATTKFDYVVIQEQSVWPFTNPTKFYSNATKMVAMARENGATPLFYSTWGRKTGHEILEQYNATTEQMAWGVASSYTKLGAALGVEVAYAGLAFLDVHTNHGDSIDLYNPDLTHPAYLGSYLAAVTIFAKLTGEDPTALTYNGSVSKDVAAILKEAARKAVFETPEIPDVSPDVPTDTPEDSTTEE